MPDQVQNYVIQITDNVSASIADKLATIADTASVAGDSITELQNSINKVNGAGLTSLANGIRSVNAVQRTLTTATQSYTRAANAAATATTAFANALPKLDAAAAKTTAQLQAMQASMGAFSGAARSVSNAASPAATNINGIGGAANGAAGGVRNMNAVLGVARGNITSANRLAGSFLSTLIGTGPIVAAAFSVLGAIALVAVLVEMVQAIGHVADAYKKMQLASAEASLQAIEDGQKIIKVQADIFTAGNAAHVLAGRSIDTSTVTIQQVQPIIEEAQRTQQLAAAQRELNEAGLKGAALQKQKKADEANTVLELVQQRDAIQDVADALRKQRTAQTTSFNLPLALTGQVQLQQTNTVTDPKQIAEIEKNFASATEQVKQLNTQIAVTQLNMQAAGRRELVAGVTDELKAARVEMVSLEKGYRDYVTSLNHKITPNETLAYWQNAEAGLKHYATNIDAVNGKEAEPLQAIASRNDNLNRTNENLNDQIASIGAYSDALKERQELDKLTIEYQKTGIPLTATEITQLRDKINLIVSSAQYQAQLAAQYTAVNGPAREYAATQRAISKLMQDDPDHIQRYQEQFSAATLKYTEAIDPLYKFNKGLSDQQALLGKFGIALQAAKQLQELTNELQQKGIFLSPDQKAGVNSQITTANKNEAVNSAYGTLTGAGKQDEGAAQVQAATLAFNAGAISAERYHTAVQSVIVAQANLQNSNGLTTWGSSVTSIFGQLTKGYTTFAAGATKAFGDFFTTLEDGFADAIGHALVFGGSVSKALLNVAKEAVAGLISALIKLGIQWVITATLGAALQAASTVTTTAVASEAAVAWAPAAAFASLATLGANAVPAEVALGTTVALADTLALIKFAAGGRVDGPGTSTSDSVPALLSRGEYVVRASAYAAHKNAVEAINNGAQYVSSYSPSGNGSSSNAPGMQVEVHNYAGVAIETQQLTDSHVRLMIRQEVPALVAQHAPTAVANDIANPNGRTSKAITNYVTSDRIR